MKTSREERKCPYCRAGRMKPGTSTLTLEREDVIVLVRDVPGRVCPTCGEAEFEEEALARLDDRVEAAFESGSELAVIRYRRRHEQEAA